MKMYDINSFISQWKWVEVKSIENSEIVFTANDCQFFIPAESVFENKFFDLNGTDKLLVIQKEGDGTVLYMLNIEELNITLVVSYE